MAKAVLQTVAPVTHVPAKFAENEPGRYYVNHECIDCDLCRQAAPANFRREPAQGHSYVYKQPENEREEQQCQAALRECPVAAIVGDGE